MTGETQQRSYWLETYGCQMNKAESGALEIELEAGGFSAAADSAAADLVILNTCSVRETAEERIWGRLGHYRYEKSRRPFVLALFGCMAERLKESLRSRYPEIDIIVGTFQKQRFLEAVESAFLLQRPQDRLEQGEYAFAPLHSSGRFKAFVPIMHGCGNFCSYCIVPHVRGPEISRAPEEILSELGTLWARGVREATLLGQNVNSYGYARNGARLDFPALLDQVSRETPSPAWIRFLTSHPKDCTRNLVERLASSSAFCRHLHLPVQHGSNRILSLMNRGYTREEYLDLVRMVKNAVSDATITTDILIGFPTEDGDDFARTLDLMREVEFDDAYTYYYNPRAGTKAFALGDTVPYDEKIRRLQEVIALNRRTAGERKRARLGRRATVLVEDVSKKHPRELLGRTEHDETVVFGGAPELIGSFVSVELAGLRGTTFRGVLAGG